MTMTVPSLSRYKVAICRSYPPERASFVANCVALWIMTLGFAVVNFVLLLRTNISTHADGLVQTNSFIATLIWPFAVFYTFVRFEEKFASVMNAFAVLVAVTPVLCLFTYIAAALGHDVPLRDDMLAHFDEAVGVHWPAMLMWANAHPVAAGFGSFAYGSLGVQGAFMMLILTIGGQTERLQVAIYAFAIGAFCCGAISAVVPALGAYTHYGIEPLQFDHIDLATRDGHVADVLALRSGATVTFSVAAAKGIITFPSFHTTLGILFSWSMWRLRWLCWPILALNVVLIAATPLQGSHYVAELLAGALVACVAVASATAIHRAVGPIAGQVARPVQVEASRFC